MCYDRTSAGKRPMCATVCPSQALFFGTRERVEELRPRSNPISSFQFGRQIITTKVNMMVPKQGNPQLVNITSAIGDQSIGKKIMNDILLDAMFDDEAHL